MKLLTRNTDYAVRAVCFMAGRGKKIAAVPELVGALKVPSPFLRKILQILNRKGIVVSHKGIGGGFELAVNPDKISLIDLIEAFQGELAINECLFKKSLCPNVRKCRLKKKIDKIERYVIAELRSITIGDLLKG